MKRGTADVLAVKRVTGNNYAIIHLAACVSQESPTTQTYSGRNRYSFESYYQKIVNL